MLQRWQDRTPTYGCLLRFGIISLVIILILGLGTLWMMATGNMLPSSWASLFTIIFVLLGVLLTFFQWIFPLSSARDQKSPSSSIPRSISYFLSSHTRASLFIHKANSTNSIKNYTIINFSTINDSADAHLFVTPIWDNDKVYNNHPIGTGYHEDIKRWAIFNQDKADMAPGTAFNVLVLEEPEEKDDWM